MNHPKKIPFQTCTFISSSDFFADFSREKAALCGADNLPFSWGNNNRTLVTVEVIVAALNNIKVQTAAFLAWCDRVGYQSYVDLEH